MTIDRDRHSGELPVFEIPLTGDAEIPVALDHEGAPPPDRRRVAAIVVACAVVVGLLAAVLVALGEDDGETATADGDTRTTSSPSTQPPPRPARVTLPRPDLPAVAPSAPSATTSQTRRLFDRVTAPTYPAVTPVGDTARFGLAAGVSELGRDVARRSTTRFEIGPEPLVIDMRVTRDVANDRYELVVHSNGLIDRWIIDVGAGWTYEAVSLDSWRRIESDEVASSLGVPDMATLAQRLLLGPLRPDTSDGAVAVDAGEFVDLGGGLVARRHDVTLPVAQLPEWATYPFAPDADAPDPDDLVAYSVYVTAEGNVRRVTGASRLGAARQVVVHDIVRLSHPAIVELPSADSVENLAEGSGG